MILIDKAELLNRIATEVHYDTEHPLEAYGKLLSEINDAPEDIVRCKDCIYYGDHGDEEMVCAMMILYPNKPTDYCSLGKRREDAKTD